MFGVATPKNLVIRADPRKLILNQKFNTLNGSNVGGGGGKNGVEGG